MRSLSAVLIPKPKGRGASARFEKLGARNYLVISIVMAAGDLEVVGGRIAGARIAIGACSPVAQRLPALEAALQRRGRRRRLARPGERRSTSQRWRRSTTCAPAPTTAARRRWCCCARLLAELARMNEISCTFRIGMTMR